MSRRFRTPGLLVLLAAAACGGPVPPWTTPPAGAIDLRITVAPTSTPLLQPVVVELDLYRRADLPVEFEPKVDAKDFQATTTTRPEVPFGPGSWQRTTLTLRPLRGPGELVLPPFVAKAKDGSIAASTPETKLAVTSTLAGADAAIEAPGEPFGPHPRLWPWVGGAAAVAALAAGFWWWRRRRPAQRLPSEVALPPHVIALRALARLRTSPRTTPAQIDAFYVEVSGVLRTYLEARFGLAAPERTTEEFLAMLESGSALAGGHRAELQRFLQQCDLVKFAAQVPGEVVHQETFAIAEQFVERTRPDRAGAPATGRPEEVPA